MEVSQALGSSSTHDIPSSVFSFVIFLITC